MCCRALATAPPHPRAAFLQLALSLHAGSLLSTCSTLAVSLPAGCGVCCRGRRALSQNGNMYISGEVAVAVGVYGQILGIELVGTGTQLMSWTGGFGYSNTIMAAPNILLLNGAIKINLASVAQANTSMYFKYVNDNDFTVALQISLQLNPGDFLGAIEAADAARSAAPSCQASWCIMFACTWWPCGGLVVALPWPVR